MKFDDFLDFQMTQDRRAFVVHFPALSGKTRYFSTVAASRKDAVLLDLQRWLLKRAITENAKVIDPEDLFKMLLDLDYQNSIIIVDNVDVVFNSWKKHMKDDFFTSLRVWLRSPSVTSNTFVFVLQDDASLAKVTLANSRNESRVLPLDAFDAIEMN